MNCGLYRPIVQPQVIVMWTMVWWYWLMLTPNLSTRMLWQPPVLSRSPVRRDISGTSRRMGEGNENVVYPSPWDFKSTLICHKIIRHETSGFTFHLEEGVLRIFITLKNPLPWPGSNPRRLGTLASTLTTTPPRRLIKYSTWPFSYPFAIGLYTYEVLSFCKVEPKFLTQHWFLSVDACNMKWKFT
jgi:hypothetical protein